ncbi:MAG: glycosyltransferase family 2 protein [Opitutales bacterium]
MEPPAISVLICVFNGERFLRQTLESVLSQDLALFEVVIVDDGSTDRTGDILAEFAAADRRISIHRQENQGLVGARNSGLGLCRSEFVAIIDADDLALPGRFRAQLEYLQSHGEVSAVSSAIQLIDSEGNHLGVRRFPTGTDEVARAMEHSCASCSGAAMFRLDHMRQLGGYRVAYGHAEDYDFWLRLTERFKIDNLPEALTAYRIHEGSLTKRNAAKQTLCALAARLAYQRRKLGQPDLFAPLTRPVTLADVDKIPLSSPERAEFIVIRFFILLDGFEERLLPELERLLEEAWALRSHVHRGRLVRHGLIPGAKALWRHGRRRAGLSWLLRGFSRDPVSSVWGLLFK